MKKGISNKNKTTNVFNYKKLTAEGLSNVLREIFKATKPIRSPTLYTGVKGAYNFSWNLMFGKTIEKKHFNLGFKHLPNIIYISLFVKHGCYKIKIKNNTFYFYKGTELIHVIESVRNQYFISDATAHVEETKLKINEVNAFIDKLYNEKSS